MDAQQAVASFIQSPVGGRVNVSDLIAAVARVPVTVTALTDNSGGAAADGTIGAITTFTPSVAWNGSSVYPSAADATAISAGITANKDAIKELATKLNALIAALS